MRETAKECVRSVLAQEAGALHSRTIENRIAAEKTAKIRRLVRII